MKKILITMLLLFLNNSVVNCKDYSNTPSVRDIPNYSFNLATAVHYIVCKNNKGGDACINYLKVETTISQSVYSPMALNVLQMIDCQKYAKCGGGQFCYDRYLK